MAEFQTTFKRDAPVETRFETIIRVSNGGTNDYSSLINKPSINEVKLVGNKKLEDLGISTISNLELEELLK